MINRFTDKNVMTNSEKLFQQFDQTLCDQGKTAALQFLANHFRGTRQFPELFEVLKANIRLNMDLPLLPTDNLDQLDESVQRQLEDQLLEACRETGYALLEDGQIAQAWMYLQPLPDRNNIKAAFEAIEINDENSAQFLDVALYGGAAPEAGYQLLLRQQGTCNGITFFDTQASYQDQSTQTNLGEILVGHIYNELRENVSAQIAEKDGPQSKEVSLIDLISDRDWLFEGCGHHLDVTHLASVVRIARCCQNEPHLQMAQELSQYGMRLDEQLHYPGDQPFTDNYKDHYMYFCGRLKQDLKNAIGHFRGKLATEKDEDDREAIRSVIVELLCCSGETKAAIDELINEKFTNADMSMLISIAQTDADYECVKKHFQQNEDLLRYCLSAIAQKQDRPT